MNAHYFLVLLTALVLAPTSWAAENPFARYQKVTSTESATFFPQTPPFKYPFTISTDVKNGDLDLAKIVLDYPEDTLNHMTEFYRGIPFNAQKSVYEYPFALHPHWEYLPYPFIKTLPRSRADQWISEFGRKSFKSMNNSLRFQEELNALTGTEAYAGNELKHLKTPDAYYEILRRLESVQDHAFISSFLFNCDKGTEPLINLIGKKARTGAKIFVLYDAFGAKSDPTCSKRLEQMGAKVVLFKTKMGTIFHEKMYVFDGNYAMIDGQNIIAAGTLSNGTNNLFNDIAVGVRGPIVTKVATRFMELWESQGQKIPLDIWAIYKKQNEEIKNYSSANAIRDGLNRSRGQGVCRLVTKSPGKNQNQILNLYLHTARNVNSYLFFNYIDPKYRDPAKKDVGEKFLDTVLERVNFRKEIRVDMLTNGWKNPFQVELPVGMSADRNLMTLMVLQLQDLITTDPHLDMTKMRKNLAAKVKTDNFHWWSYAQYMHAKTLMSDNIWTIIGSYNLNAGSEYQSYEMVLACHDSDLAMSMQNSIILDTVNSIPVPLDP
jgi:phosphatidylserine/phosphatidylglycerophosphate/cardiolipin synthase-like enzyme